MRYVLCSYKSLVTIIETGFVQIMTPHSRTDEFIADFCDAQLFKQHPLFGKDESALQIILYYDEVETANCLGSHAGYNSKLGKRNTLTNNVLFSLINLIYLYRHVLLHFGKFKTRTTINSPSNPTGSMCVLLSFGKIWL